MASDFVLSFTTPLLQSKDQFSAATEAVTTTTTTGSSTLSALLASLDKPHLTTHEIAKAAETLQTHDGIVTTTSNDDDELLKQAIIAKISVALYADALELHIQQAVALEEEAQWWADTERSTAHVAWYLLQTLPRRLADLFAMVTHHVHAQNPSLGSLRALSVRSLVQTVGGTVGALRPGVLVGALFPRPRTVVGPASVGMGSWKGVLWPVRLAKEECRYNRLELERLRDERARTLGELALLRGPGQKPEELVQKLLFVLSSSSITGVATPPDFSMPQSPVSLIQHLSTITLPTLSTSHLPTLRAHDLLRPSRLTQLWPKLLLLPPLALLTLRLVASSTPAIAAFFHDAKATTEAFVQGWLLDPLRDVLRTIRAGSANPVLVRPEGVRADMDSLERMATSLAVDVLGYAPSDTARLDALRADVRAGDMGDIMRLYEEDLRRPLASAVRGSLVRGILVQVQKAKVDLDQALAGIDRLLKSQELTFAFVGVAPALGVSYLVLGMLGRALFVDERDRAQRRFGGAARRGEVWSDMRRIERILIRQHEEEGEGQQLSALSTGLVLLSLTRLRAYAQKHLPAGSKGTGKKALGHAYPQIGGMRAAFLEDLSDLEDPDLGRHAKMRVVERMWRCWGSTLGWK